MDSAGNVYFADTANNRVRKISKGVITTVAGDGTFGFGGDNGLATSAQLSQPSGVVLDPSGNLYIADTINNRIRKVSNGVITTVAGNGKQGFAGDNGPATNAEFIEPFGLALDPSGNLYVSDTYNYRVRKISNGIITTVAGNGTQGFSGDSGPATNAQLSFFNLFGGIAVDSGGNLYIADSGNSRIRKVSNGVITTVAGGGSSSNASGSATNATLSYPEGVAVDSSGSLFIADGGTGLISKVSNGVISTVAGGGSSFGDNIPATSAKLAVSPSIAIDSTGKVYFGDYYNGRMRLS